MPDLDKTIRDLEYLISFGGASQQSMVMQIASDAIALLRKQEAVEPTWSRGKPFCGACGLRIHGGKFCSECGKPILWKGR